MPQTLSRMNTRCLINQNFLQSGPEAGVVVGSVPQSWCVCSVSCGSCSCFRLCVGVWEERAALARLKEKLQMEDGRLVLRIEREEWKVKPSTQVC